MLYKANGQRLSLHYWVRVEWTLHFFMLCRHPACIHYSVVHAEPFTIFQEMKTKTFFFTMVCAHSNMCNKMLMVRLLLCGHSQQSMKVTALAWRFNKAPVTWVLSFHALPLTLNNKITNTHISTWANLMWGGGRFARFLLTFTSILLGES